METAGRGRIGMVLAVAVLAIGASWLAFGGPEGPSREERDGETDEVVDRGSRRHVRRSDSESARKRGEAPGDTAAKRLIAAELRARLHRAREARRPTKTAHETAPHGHAPPGETQQRPTLDREYIRDAVREVVPLIAECYELARDEDPTLEGRLIVEFDIEGEPDVGGIVEGSRIADDSPLRHPLLEECVRETMYTLALPAPDGPGSVHVRYPFVLSPDDGDERENEDEE